MELMYTSTRNANEKVTASQAILKGLAEDGGLFVPEQLPTLDKTVDELAGMTYQETAYEVMKKFLTDFTEEELKNCINAAYDSKFDTEEIDLNIGLDTFDNTRMMLFNENRVYANLLKEKKFEFFANSFFIEVTK